MNDNTANAWTYMLSLNIKKNITQSSAKRIAIKNEIFDNIVKLLYVFLNCQTGH